MRTMIHELVEAGACWFCGRTLHVGVERDADGNERAYNEARRVVLDTPASNDNGAPRARRRLRVTACASCSSRKGRRGLDWMRGVSGGAAHLFAGELELLVRAQRMLDDAAEVCAPERA